jgi:hypothetical protein
VAALQQDLVGVDQGFHMRDGLIHQPKLLVR